MRKGNQVKAIGRWPYGGTDNIASYSWPRMYRHLTQEEIREWYERPESKGVNSAGESKLPPTCALVEFDGGKCYNTDWDLGRRTRRLSNDTFTIVRARCAPVIGYSKWSGMTLVRNNRTGEEGYFKRKWIELVNSPCN